MEIFSKLIIYIGILVYLSSCGGGDNSDQIDCSNGFYIPFQEKEDGRWGFINIEGEEVIAPEFRTMPTVTFNGISLITEIEEKIKHYDFIKIIADGDKYSIEELDYDLANALMYSEEKAVIVRENEKIQVIDESFTVLLTLDSFEFAGSFHNGLAPVANMYKKWGYIDGNGKNIIPCQYDEVTVFNENHAVATTIPTDEEGTISSVLINSEGAVVVDFKDKYESFGLFKNGMLAVYDGTSWSFVNSMGEKVITPNDNWKSITNFHNGFASFQEDRDWGVINAKGEMVVRPKYNHPLIFDNGMAPIIDEERKVGFINVEGIKIIKSHFDGIAFPFFCDNAIVKDGKYFVFIDKEGNALNTNEHKNVSMDDRFAYKKRKRNQFYRLAADWESAIKPIQSQYLDIDNILTGCIGDMKELRANSGNAVATLNKLGFTGDLEKGLNLTGSYYHGKSKNNINRLPLNVSYNDIKVYFDNNAKYPVRNEYGYVSHYVSNLSTTPNGISQIKFTIKLSGKAKRKEEDVETALKARLQQLEFVENSAKSYEYINDDGNRVAHVKTSSSTIYLTLFFYNKEELAGE